MPSHYDILRGLQGLDAGVPAGMGAAGPAIMGAPPGAGVPAPPGGGMGAPAVFGAPGAGAEEAAALIDEPERPQLADIVEFTRRYDLDGLLRYDPLSRTLWLGPHRIRDYQVLNGRAYAPVEELADLVGELVRNMERSATE